MTGGTVAAQGESFQITRKPEGVTFLRRAVQPPSQVYVENIDQISVSCASSVVGETVTVNYRLLRFDGEIVEGQFAVRPASNRTVTTYTETLTEGFLLTVSCRAAVATTRGQTFVRIFLSSPAFAGNLPSYMLMADYVTNTMAPGHPNGRVLAPSEGPGWPHSAIAAVPAAGANATITVPANARWRVGSAYGQLTTSAAVANRFGGVLVTSAGVLVFAGMSPDAQAASLVRIYSGSGFSAESLAGSGFGAWSLPVNTFLLGGDVVRTVTANLDAADQWNAFEISVEEWLDNV